MWISHRDDSCNGLNPRRLQPLRIGCGCTSVSCCSKCIMPHCFAPRSSHDLRFTIDSWPPHSNCSSAKNWLSHVDFDIAHFSIAANPPLHFKNAASCFYSQRIFITNPAVNNKFRDASNSIAAHLRFASVGIKNAHACMGFRLNTWRANQNQTISADCSMPITDSARKRRRIDDIFSNRINIDVVITNAMHLGKAHLFISPGEGLSLSR